MKIEACVALVTGANRGLGAAFARGLLAEGALESLQRQFETNAAGPLRLVQAFAPVLAVHAGLAGDPPLYIGTGA